MCPVPGPEAHMLNGEPGSLYGMKNELECVVYNQAQGFQITFPNLAVSDEDQLEVPIFDSKFSFALFFGCAKVIIGNRKLINPMFS